MTGVKAVWLEGWARDRGQSFLRFDYRGHGASSGRFEDHTIGDWAADAVEVVSALTEGPQILVGSSMGGWLSLLVARRLPDRIAGFVGIAAAPDFTEDGAWDRLTPDQRATMMREGQVRIPSAYSDAPYIYTRRLFEDGRNHLVLRSPYKASFPVRLLHGSADVDVPVTVGQRLFEHLDGDDIRLILVKGGDHRLSEPQHLRLLGQTVAELSDQLS